MRKEKQLLLDEIKAQADNSSGFILTSYSNLKANAVHDLRSKLGVAGGYLEVVRKRVFMKILQGGPLAEFSLKDLSGHIGVIFIKDDPVELTKAIFRYGREKEDSLTVLGGCFENRLLRVSDVQRLSTLPSKDVMRSQLIGTLIAPQQQVLATMESLLTSVIWCLANKSEEAA